MGKIFCGEFQRYPLKLHTKYLSHTLTDMILYNIETLRALKFKSSYAVFETLPGRVYMQDQYLKDSWSCSQCSSPDVSTIGPPTCAKGHRLCRSLSYYIITLLRSILLPQRVLCLQVLSILAPSMPIFFSRGQSFRIRFRMIYEKKHRNWFPCMVWLFDPHDMVFDGGICQRGRYSLSNKIWSAATALLDINPLPEAMTNCWQLDFKKLTQVIF